MMEQRSLAFTVKSGQMGLSEDLASSLMPLQLYNNNLIRMKFEDKYAVSENID